MAAQGWLVGCIWVCCHFNGYGHIMVISDALVSWLSHISTITTLLSKASYYFSHMLLQSERRKCAGQKVRLNWGSNSQPTGHETDMLITEPPGLGRQLKGKCSFFVDKRALVFTCRLNDWDVTIYNIIRYFSL